MSVLFQYTGLYLATGYFAKENDLYIIHEHNVNLISKKYENFNYAVLTDIEDSIYLNKHHHSYIIRNSINSNPGFNYKISCRVFISNYFRHYKAYKDN